MNKVSRLLGSATLATGLIFGGSAGVAYAGDNNGDRHGSSHSRDHNDRDRDRDRKCHQHDGRHHNHYSHHRDGRSDNNCNHRHERVYYKDYNGNWKSVVIVVFFR
ncbi:hypothetical protein [Arthrobacter sp. P2b]|uniref:hypothetical protein n=1 Tax=Arthrobacter sp. P2b TaxID=1938741 RepID=UPI0009A7ABD6|nr:hypothetical protein [Arthrobacter sp. P2b]SLK05279.1 hypothetical protein SAMN06272721_105205 [Arthrobacter sp. P2b]